MYGDQIFKARSWIVIIFLSFVINNLFVGLMRCGKSCRLRWINYLRPDIKRGNFSKDEEETILNLHRVLGNRYLVLILLFFFFQIICL